MKKIFTFLSATFLCINVQSQTFTTVAGTFTTGYSGDGGQATSAQINGVGGMAFDQSGNLYFSDRGNHVIRKINTAGIISTIAGNGTAGSSGDGGAATSAKLNSPENIAIDATGNLYIKEPQNGKIRKVDLSGNISTYATIATNSSGGGRAMAIDASGNLYVNNANNVIVQKINTSTVTTTYAGMVGTQGATGDGGAATSAKLWQAYSLTTDVSGSLYIAEFQANTIRKVNSAGIISTIAGTFNSTSTQGFGGMVGDGGPATAAYLATPRSMAVNSLGDLYFATDYGKIRLINSAGIINTIEAGNNIYYADLLIFDSSNNLYYIEGVGGQIKKITNIQIQTSLKESAETKINFSVYPNPANKSFTINIADPLKPTQAYIVDVLGQKVLSVTINQSNTELDINHLPVGIYFVTLNSGNKTTTQKLVIE